MASLKLEDQVRISEKPLSANIRELALKAISHKGNRSGYGNSIYHLLFNLAGHPIAQRLRPTYRTVDRELALIYVQLDTDDFDLSPFTPLITLIAKKADDVKVWQAVLDLILTFSLTSLKPLKSIPGSFNGTPHTYSSALFRDSVQRRKDLEESLRTELAKCTYINVQGPFTKYFENQSWSTAFGHLLTRVAEDATLYGFPDNAQPEEKELWEWLDRFQRKYLGQARGVYYRATSKAAIVDDQGQSQLDIFIKDRNAPVEEPHSARDLLVVGELTKSPKTETWRENYLRIATYVRDIFAAQPTRWFVHGFLMFGLQMELWVFDRSGAYSSEIFDIREHFEWFIRIITGYTMMNDPELGLSPAIQHDKLGASVTVTDISMAKEFELQLELPPIVYQTAIVSRGTTCFRTRDGTKVVKMSWRSDKQHSEIDLLTAAQGVRGIPQLIGFRNVTTIGQLRSGLLITTQRFLEEQVLKDISPQTSQSGYALGKPDVSSAERRSNSTDRTTSERHRSSQIPNPQQVAKTDSIDSKIPKQNSLSPERSLYQDRVLTYLAIAPAGRPLSHFQSILEVLQAFRDAIKAHRSLFIERNILHRDTSMNNIILTDPTQNEGCTGMLIDLDLAVFVGKDGRNEISGEKTMTGTLQYMAIQVLENGHRTVGIDHTYRHDLESFFYVFLWLCIRYGWTKNSKHNKDALKTWYTAFPNDIARAKRGELEPGGFEVHTLNEFSPTFESQKDLARLWRNVLFGRGALCIETPKKPETLYGPIIKAIEDAIREIKCRQRGLRSRSALKKISYNESASQPERPWSSEQYLTGNSRKRKRKAKPRKTQLKRMRCG